MSGARNPLRAQAIVAIVVGAALLCAGAWGTVRGLSDARRLESRLHMGVRKPAVPTRAPTSLTGFASFAANLKAQVQQYRSVLAMGWTVLLGGGLIFAGARLLKQVEWARYATFGGVAFAVLYFATLLGSRAVVFTKTGPETHLALPLILVSLVSALAAKPLFDLITERFER